MHATTSLGYRSVYDMTTLTNIELEHAQSIQHMAVVDVVDRHGRSNSTICSVRGPYQSLISIDSSLFLTSRER